MGWGPGMELLDLTLFIYKEMWGSSAFGMARSQGIGGMDKKNKFLNPKGKITLISVFECPNMESLM